MRETEEVVVVFDDIRHVSQFQFQLVYFVFILLHFLLYTFQSKLAGHPLVEREASARGILDSILDIFVVLDHCIHEQRDKNKGQELAKVVVVYPKFVFVVVVEAQFYFEFLVRGERRVSRIQNRKVEDDQMSPSLTGSGSSTLPIGYDYVGP